MKSLNAISFKSIPSFIIFLPIISLLLATFIILYIIHDIKNEMIEDEKKTIFIKHYEDQKSHIQSRVNQTIQELQILTQYELLEHKERLIKELGFFLELFAHEDIKTTHMNQKIKIYNKQHPFYRISLITEEKFDQLCTQTASKECSVLLKNKKGFLFANDEDATLKYYYHNPKDGLIYLIQLEKTQLYHELSKKMLKVISQIKLKHNEFFHIVDGKGRLLTENDSSENYTLFHNSEAKGFILKRLNQLKEKEVTFELACDDTDKGVDKDLYFAKYFQAFDWIVIMQKPLTLLDDASKKLIDHKITYFNNRIKELTIIISLVTIIIIIASFLISRIMTQLFQRFRKHIITQNQKLKDFNHQLSMKVKDKVQELQKSESRYRTIFERSPDAIFILEGETITYCNESAVKMFTRDRKGSLIHTPISDLFPKFQPDGNDSKKLCQDYLGMTQTLGHSRFEWLVRRSDGTTFFVDVWLQQIEIEQSSVTHVVFRNIDAQIKAQQKIKEQHQELMALNENLEERVQLEVQKNKKKEQLLLQQSRLAQMGEMIAMIAHQWRQPLSAISTSSAHLKLLIDLNDYSEEILKEGLDNVDNYVQYLSKTIDDFRDFFKPDKQKTQTTLNELIKHSLSIIGSSLQTNNITLFFEEEHDYPLTIFAHEMMQVILNIIKNAEDILLQRKVDNPYIKIECREDQQYFYIAISDNAQGINDEILDKVFDPYFSTKNDKNGTGLGLYMSKVIVNDHCQGNLEVANTDTGAMFTITLPKDVTR